MMLDVRRAVNVGFAFKRDFVKPFAAKTRGGFYESIFIAVANSFCIKLFFGFFKELSKLQINGKTSAVTAFFN